MTQSQCFVLEYVRSYRLLPVTRYTLMIDDNTTPEATPVEPAAEPATTPDAPATETPAA